MQRYRKHLCVPATLATLLVLGGCAEVQEAIDEPGQFLEQEVAGARSSLRALTLSPGLGITDWFLNDDEEPTFAGVGFLDPTTYRDVGAGIYDFFVSPEGETAEGAMLTLRDEELADERTGTLVAFDGPDGLSTMRLEDDPEDLDRENDVRLRFLHGAPSVGEVDVRVVTEEGETVPAFEDVRLGDQTEPLDVAAGRYTVEVDATGDGMSDLVFELPRVGAGSVVNLFAVQDEDDEVFLWALIDGTVAVRLEAYDETDDEADDDDESEGG